jgi:hypothetical protein
VINFVKKCFEEILWKESQEKSFVERRFWRNFVEKMRNKIQKMLKKKNKKLLKKKSVEKNQKKEKIPPLLLSRVRVAGSSPPSQPLSAAPYPDLPEGNPTRPCTLLVPKEPRHRQRVAALPKERVVSREAWM